MNFQELLSRIAELDNPLVGEELKGGQTKLDVDKDGDIEGDDLADLRARKQAKEDVLDVEECGMGPMEPMKQQDNVSMNISMNGSGAGGIRDLLDILKDIDQGPDDMGGDPEAGELGALIGKMGDEPGGKVAVIGDEIPVDEYANEPDEVYGGVDQVIPTGNDIHSKGAEAEKVNGGGNPFNVDEEALIARLSSLYETIKSR